MSIEKDLSRIATALESIAAAMIAKSAVVEKPAVDPTAIAVNLTPVKAEVSAPVAPAAPVVAAPVVPPVVVAPVPAPAPVAATPIVAVQSGSAPFTDAKGLMEYVMSKYKALGPIKGAEIQGVLGSLGYKNINEVKPEQYGEFHSKVEAL